MGKIFRILGLLVFVLGIVFIPLGEKIGIPNPEPYAGVIMGLGLTLVGLDGIVRGHSTEGQGRTRITHYGWSARFRGAGLALLGLVVVACGVLEATGKGNLSLLLGTTSGSGLLAMTLSLFGMIGSGVLLSEKPRNSALLALPGRIAGGLLLLLSILVFVISLVVLIAPDTANQLLRHFLAR